MIGDGEAETGPLAASWHSNKFLNPVTDGAVLPILHLNGYKIANPTVPGPHPAPTSSTALLTGYGYRVHVVEGDDPKLRAPSSWPPRSTSIVDRDPRRSSGAPASWRRPERPRWPVIVLRTPKGWTGPKVVDGLPVEGTWRAHQVPIAEARANPEHLRQLEEWMRTYRPEELFDPTGALRARARRGWPRRTTGG